MKISIPTHCHENWEEMTPNERGRFCAHCQKIVVDFTGWSDKALIDFFEKNIGDTCGRFSVQQLDRKLSKTDQHYKLHRFLIFLGLSSIFIHISPITDAQTPIAKVPTTHKKSTLKPTTSITGIQGRLFNNDSISIQGMRLELYDSLNQLVSITNSDMDGCFAFYNIRPNIYRIIASNVETEIYQKTTLKEIPVSHNHVTTANIKVYYREPTENEMSVISGTVQVTNAIVVKHRRRLFHFLKREKHK